MKSLHIAFIGYAVNRDDNVDRWLMVVDRRLERFYMDEGHRTMIHGRGNRVSEQITKTFNLAAQYKPVV